MLLEFRVANFRSFAEEQVFSFVADKDDTHLENTMECEQSPTGRVTRLAVLYGPNGGGKSALVRAIAAMQGMVVNSARWQEGDRLMSLEPFKLDAALAHAPCRFEATFVADWADPEDPETVRPVRYQYGFSADVERVDEEWLLAYPHGQPQTWFERDPDGFDFGRHLRGEKKRIADATRSNALFLSVAAQQNQQHLLPVFRWLRTHLMAIGVAGEQELGDPVIRRRPLASARTNVALDKGHDEARKYIVDFLREADVGIDDIRLERSRFDAASLPPGFPPELKALVVEQQEEREMVEVRTVHRGRHGEPVEWNLSDESEGTQNLYCLLGPWLETVFFERSAFFDELFSDLHPVLARRLLERFCKEGSKGQVLLTTHDTNLLDSNLLRRDQVWFVEKNPDGASRLYSMLEYRPRKGENFEKGYLAGRYGALPFIGDVRF